jgi:hypothetical protein
MSNAYSTPWDKGRPVFLRLPRDGYQNNPDVEALLTQPDEFLTRTKTLLETLYQRLDPLVCPVEWLDYLGWLNGWSAEYWDTLWTPEVKRALIVISNSVWGGLGQQQILGLVLSTQGVEHRIWTAKSLQLPFTLPGTMDTPKGKLFIRVPLKYLRNGRLFKEAERTRTNFVPCVISSKVTYEYFYLGFSALGEPLFSV